jgi:predicted DCC family thiol-disulfide oxidoreductase YuxK
MSGSVLTVYFDAECGVCRLLVLALGRLDWHHRLAPIPLQCYDEGRPARDELASELHVRDAAGRWSRGGGAALRIAAAVPVLVPLAILGGLPGARHVVDAAYRFVAHRRPAISHALRLDASGRRLRPLARS